MVAYEVKLTVLFCIPEKDFLSDRRKFQATRAAANVVAAITAASPGSLEHNSRIDAPAFQPPKAVLGDRPRATLFVLQNVSFKPN